MLKARVLYMIAMLLVMALGYSSRALADNLPVFVADHFGDALWASMIYYGVRALWIHKSLRRAWLISILFCFAIELSQLYQADWINGIRSTFLGSLILGSGYLTVDLVRYSAGVTLALLIDMSYRKVKGGQLYANDG